METYDQHLTLPYPVNFVFNIVQDVSAYPSFLPWIHKADVWPVDATTFKADLTIGYKAISLTYRSHVTLIPNEKITAVSETSPFRFLKNIWSFNALSEQQTHIHLHLAFEFDNLVMHMMLRQKFKDIVVKMSAGFQQRATVLAATI